MAILKTAGNYPKRIGNFVIYTSRGQTILRTCSGFTTAALKKEKKYKKCRQNANEFGNVSSLCKEIRLVLKDLLPKKNNLEVVNTFTKTMHAVMRCDTISSKGKRNLATAMETTEAKTMLKNYHFNLNAAVSLEYSLTEAINVASVNLKPLKGAHYLGAKVHYFTFDFTTKMAQLNSSAIVFYKIRQLPEQLQLALPERPQNCTGFLFTILELEYYTCKKIFFSPLVNDTSKVVMILDVIDC